MSSLRRLINWIIVLGVIVIIGLILYDGLNLSFSGIGIPSLTLDDNNDGFIDGKDGGFQGILSFVLMHSLEILLILIFLYLAMKGPTIFKWIGGLIFILVAIGVFLYGTQGFFNKIQEIRQWSNTPTSVAPQQHSSAPVQRTTPADIFTRYVEIDRGGQEIIRIPPGKRFCSQDRYEDETIYPGFRIIGMRDGVENPANVESDSVKVSLSMEAKGDLIFWYGFVPLGRRCSAYQ